eukprot:CAMPEP_0194046046 /NCGR_PEP_ID=MMETSP0009_2-20130614/19151_1 /TAXON_ID=210454 /ORGANISM="Grammatophora oceanica, Strain CCMP 410" /LENGTH=235 /DNA_ID=CAMNT_0038691165 /DNA_START=56 /DNA_END=763 /DNA_ORIENTATION=-
MKLLLLILSIACAAVRANTKEGDEFEVIERILTQSSDCQSDYGPQTELIHMDVQVWTMKTPRELWCLVPDMDEIETVIQDKIHAEGLSGGIRDDLDNPVQFDAVVCKEQTAYTIVNRKLGGLRGEGSSGAQRQLQFGWPFNTGAGGGCYSCARENCDDDTNSDSGCRRRRELWDASEASEESFRKAKRAIEDRLVASIQGGIKQRVQCMQTVPTSSIHVSVDVRAVPLEEWGCSN